MEIINKLSQVTLINGNVVSGTIVSYTTKSMILKSNNEAVIINNPDVNILTIKVNDYFNEKKPILENKHKENIKKLSQLREEEQKMTREMIAKKLKTFQPTNPPAHNYVTPYFKK